MTMNCRIPYHARFRITIFGVKPLWACAIFSDNKKESKRCEPLVLGLCRYVQVSSISYEKFDVKIGPIK